MDKGIYLFFSNCTDPGREEEFNRWYSHTHVPELSAARGLVGARRFVSLRPSQAAFKYMSLYEFESANVLESVADLSRIARDAMDEGRHIECIEGYGAYVFQEIEPSQYKPLDTVDYPKGGRVKNNQ